MKNHNKTGAGESRSCLITRIFCRFKPVIPAFSLMEMMVVMVIVAVIVAVAAPLVTKKSANSGGAGSATLWAGSSDGKGAGIGSQRYMFIGGDQSIGTTFSSAISSWGINNAGIPRLTINGADTNVEMPQIGFMVDGNTTGVIMMASGNRMAIGGNSRATGDGFAVGHNTFSKDCDALGTGSQCNPADATRITYNAFVVNGRTNIVIGDRPSETPDYIDLIKMDAKILQFDVEDGFELISGDYNTGASGDYTSGAEIPADTGVQSSGGLTTDFYDADSMYLYNNMNIGNATQIEGDEGLNIWETLQLNKSQEGSRFIVSETITTADMTVKDDEGKRKSLYAPQIDAGTIDVKTEKGTRGSVSAPTITMSSVMDCADSECGELSSLSGIRAAYGDVVTEKNNIDNALTAAKQAKEEAQESLNDCNSSLSSCYTTLGGRINACEAKKNKKTALPSSLFKEKTTLACAISGDIISSDLRVKDIIGENLDAMDKVNRLKVYDFRYKFDKTKTPRVGVIAQELKKIFPNAVIMGCDGYLRIRHEEMLYSMINALKEFDAKIKDITENVALNIKTIASHKAKIKELKSEIKIQNKQIKKLKLETKKLKKLAKKL